MQVTTRTHVALGQLCATDSGIRDSGTLWRPQKLAAPDAPHLRPPSAADWLTRARGRPERGRSEGLWRGQEGLEVTGEVGLPVLSSLLACETRLPRPPRFSASILVVTSENSETVGRKSYRVHS